MQWKNPNELFGQPNICRRKRTLGSSNNQRGLRTAALHALFPVDLSDFSLSFLLLSSLQTHQTPRSPSNSPSCTQTQGLCTSCCRTWSAFPWKRGLPTLFIHCTDAPPQKPLPRPSRLSKLMCIYFMSPSWISSDSITANFMSLVLCWVDPSKVQNETHLPPQRCFCHSLHFSTGKMHPTTTWSQPFGVLSFLYTQHPISNFVGSAFKNIS